MALQGNGSRTGLPRARHPGLRAAVVAIATGVLAALPLAPAAAGQACAWTNASGDRSWQTAANWSCGRMPGADDDAVIDLPGDYTVTTAGDITVGSLQLGVRHEQTGLPTQHQTLDLAGRRLTIDRPSSVLGQGRLWSQTGSSIIDGPGTLLNEGRIWMRNTTVEVDLTNAVQQSGLPVGWIQIRGNSEFRGAFRNDAFLQVVREGSTASNTGLPTLTVAQGFSSVHLQLFAEANFASGTVALRVVGGAIVNEGLLTTRGFAASAGRPLVLEAELDNRGDVHLITPSLTLTGEDAAHVNSGSIQFPTDDGTDGSTADLVIDTSGGATFTNRGLIDIPPGRTATVTGAGTFRNEGTVRHGREVTGTGPLAFGVAGTSRPGIDVTAHGTLSAMTVDDVGDEHPEADAGTATGRHWVITAEGDGFNADLVLPHDRAVDDEPEACRFAEAGWDCDADTRTASTVTRQGLTSFSAWAVGVRTEPQPDPGTAASVRATVTVPAVEACLLVSTSAIDFGTVAVGDEATSPQYSVSSCSTGEQEVFARATDAANGDATVGWQLADPPPAGGGRVCRGR